MARRDNFHCYRNIFAIDPGYSYENGTGYAVFDGDNFHLKACGLIRPFAPNMENHTTTIEIAEKVRRIWEQEVGFSFDPKVLCIEHPLACFTKNGVRVNSNSIITLAILCTRIEERFKAKTILRPYPHVWKKRDTKEQTKAMVLNTLDAWSLKKLAQGLSTVIPSLHHNIFDAVGLGLWAIQSKETESKMQKE